MKTLSLLLVALLLGACASSKSGDVYTRDQARREMTVRKGIVESVRPVTPTATAGPASVTIASRSRSGWTG